MAVKKKKDGLNSISRLTFREKWIIYPPIIIFVILCIIPFIVLISASFSDSEYVKFNGAKLWPVGFTTAAYSIVFRFPEQILRSYLVSICSTVLGTALFLVLCMPLAFALSKPTFTWRNKISFVFFFTVMFSGGYVPTYILYRNFYGIYDTIWVLAVPNAVIVGYMIYLRTFFGAIPSELYEAAEIEGAGEWQSMFRIGIPLIIPGISTVTFYVVLFYWNDSSTALYYTESDNMVPIALYITRLQNYIEFLKFAQGGGVTGGDFSDFEIPDTTLVYSTAVIASAPMLFLFTLFQKYFVRGLTAGAVKG